MKTLIVNLSTSISANIIMFSTHQDMYQTKPGLAKNSVYMGGHYVKTIFAKLEEQKN